MRTLVGALLLSLALTHSLAQTSTLVLDTTMFTPDQQIYLASVNQWLYHPGHNPAWSSPNLATKGWINRKLKDFSIKDVNKSGRAEGWFRLQLRLDSTFKGIPVFFRKSGWAAADLYVDGRLLASYGSTGTHGKPYEHYYFYNQLATSVFLTPGQTHLIALHLVDYPSPINPGRLKSEIGIDPKDSFRLIGDRYQRSAIQIKATLDYLIVFNWAVSLVVSLLLWLVASQPLGSKEKSVIQLLAIQSSLQTVTLAIIGLVSRLKPSWGSFVGIIGQALGGLGNFLAVALLLAILLRMVNHPWSRRAILPLMLVTIAAFSIDQLSIGYPFRVSTFVFGLLILAMLYVLIAFRKRLQGAQWAIVGGLMVTLLLALVVVFGGFLEAQNRFSSTVLVGTFLVNMYPLAIPVSFLVYVALRFKEMLNEVRAQASAVLQITEEKRQLLANQNQILEQQVEARTAQLKASQAQLIQKEKLASLGELTAGIAHEIQNPLNFVNNFSEVSAELMGELTDELDKGDTDEARVLAGDLRQNLHKITQHGQRASNIVRSMLEHSRASTGQKAPTDLNALCEEYLKIAYHGMRAKDKNGSTGGFNCELVTDFDSSLAQVDVVPQELGRVLLNLFSNAFYAVQQRQKQLNTDRAYVPTVRVSTHQQRQGVEIRVRDNGVGIADSIREKIFQPFFTTKPTGEGTGLGLSLSYDIVTKGHGGMMEVEQTDDSGTTFLIKLPTKPISV